METLHTVITILQVICAIATVVLVMLQTGKNGLSGAITGSTESFMSKNKSFGKEARLSLFTKVFGILFVVLTFVLTLLQANILSNTPVA